MHRNPAETPRAGNGPNASAGGRGHPAADTWAHPLVLPTCHRPIYTQPASPRPLPFSCSQSQESRGTGAEQNREGGYWSARCGDEGEVGRRRQVAPAPAMASSSKASDSSSQRSKVSVASRFHACRLRRPDLPNPIGRSLPLHVSLFWVLCSGRIRGWAGTPPPPPPPP